MKSTVMVIPSIVAGLILLFFSNWNTCPQDFKRIIKFALITDIEGPGFLIALSQKTALEIGMEEINKSGGLLGHKAELLVRDSQLNPKLGALLARSLIQKEKVDFLLGPTSPSVALTISKVCKENRKVIVMHGANIEHLSMQFGHRYLFQVIPSSYMEGQAVARFLNEKKFKRVALIGPNIPYGRSVGAAFKRRLSEINPQAAVIKECWPEIGEKNYKECILNFMRLKPGIIFAILWSGDLANFIREASAAGLFIKTSLIGLFDQELLKGLGVELAPNLYGYDRAPFYFIHNDAMNSFVQKYKARTGEYPSAWAVMAYDGLMALKSGIEKAGSFDTEKVIGALEGLQWDSLRGPLRFRASDHLTNAGIYFGTPGKDPHFPFPVLQNMTYLPGQEVWPSEEEIKSRRK
jgi:branched-chain amino acid transport system substrate-binding protein